VFFIGLPGYRFRGRIGLSDFGALRRASPPRGGKKAAAFGEGTDGSFTGAVLRIAEPRGARNRGGERPMQWAVTTTTIDREATP
jgi:hypothetical protein